ARTDRMYPPLWYSANGYSGRSPATASLGRIAFTRVPPGAASPALLDSTAGFDTVVLSQVCDIKTSVPDSFKRALVNWVGQGHKLIITDAVPADNTNPPTNTF